MSGASERLEGRHAFPIAVPEAALASAAIGFSGGTHVGDSGSIGVSIAGWDGARLGVPGSSLTSSDPEVLAVHSDGTYEALQEGTAEVLITPYLPRNGETRPAGEALNQTVAAVAEDRAPARLSASLPPSLPFWELGPKFCGRWVSGNKKYPAESGACGALHRRNVPGAEPALRR